MAASPYHWGILNLSIDHTLLVTGTFRVLELEAIMPDGLLVHHSAGGDELDLTLTPYADAIGQSPITIHLAVPMAKTGGNAAPGDLARFTSVDGPLIADENTGEDEIRIPRLRPQITPDCLPPVANQRPPPQKYVSFPLAQVIYRNETFVLTEFLPPMLRVGAHSVLGRLCNDFCRRAREKALLLNERAGSSSTAGNQPMLQETQAEIRGLVTGLPPLEALLASGVAHPFTIYLSLCGVVGNMAGFSAGASPPVLSRYDHNNLEASFGEIRDFLLRMLDRVKESTVGVPFHFENGRFLLKLEEAWMRPRLVVGVRGAISMSDNDVAAWVDNSLIASSRRTEMLWEMRVMGAARKIIETSRDMDIVPARGVMLVEIDNDPNYIMAGDTLEIWNLENRGVSNRPTEVVLYVPGEGRSA